MSGARYVVVDQPFAGETRSAVVDRATDAVLVRGMSRTGAALRAEELNAAHDAAETEMRQTRTAVSILADSLVAHSRVDTRWIDDDTGTLEVVIDGERYRLKLERMR